METGRCVLCSAGEVFYIKGVRSAQRTVLKLQLQVDMSGDDVVQFTTAVSLNSGNNTSFHWLYLFSKMLTPETYDTAVVEGLCLRCRYVKSLGNSPKFSHFILEVTKTKLHQISWQSIKQQSRRCCKCQEASSSSGDHERTIQNGGPKDSPIMLLGRQLPLRDSQLLLVSCCISFFLFFLAGNKHSDASFSSIQIWKEVIVNVGGQRHT